METGPEKKHQSRRTALKKLLMSTGMAVGLTALPEKWIKPVMAVVLVPAHAEISPSCLVLRSELLKKIRLDCNKPLVNEQRLIIEIDDITEPRCPKLFIRDWYDAQWVWGLTLFISSYGEDSEKILEIYLRGAGSSWPMTQHCNSAHESSRPISYGFQSRSGDIWLIKGTQTRGLIPSPYIELTDIHFVFLRTSY